MINTYRNNNGFTLIELMVTLAVLAVVLGLGVPMFRDSIARGNVVSEANRLLSSINFARSQAVAKGQIVTIARQGGAAQDWTQGWLAFTDTGREGNQDFVAADGDIELKTFSPNAGQIAIRTNAAAASWITFNERGQNITTGGAITIAICDSNTSSIIPGQQIVINQVGRATSTTIAAASKAALCTP